MAEQDDEEETWCLTLPNGEKIYIDDIREICSHFPPVRYPVILRDKMEKAKFIKCVNTEVAPRISKDEDRFNICKSLSLDYKVNGCDCYMYFFDYDYDGDHVIHERVPVGDYKKFINYVKRRKNSARRKLL